VFQADGKPWVGAHVAYTEEDTGDKGHAVVRVLADDECLPLGAEDNFFVGDHAGHAYGVDGDAVNIGAAGAVEGLGGGVGHGRQVGGAPGGGDAFGGVDGGAAGGIKFVGVVVFDDFGGVEVIVDKMSKPYLDGATIGFADSIDRQGFTIDNPNAAGSCACGDSFH